MWGVIAWWGVCTGGSLVHAQQPPPRQPAAAPARPAPAPLVDDGPLKGLDREKLPPDYVPPKEATDQFKTEKQWTYSPYNGDGEKARKEFARFDAIKRSTDPVSERDRELIRERVRTELSAWTLKVNRDKVHSMREKFLAQIRSIHTAARPAPPVRLEFLAATVDESQKLLDMHFVARLNVAILWAELNELESFTGVREVPYKGVANAQLKLLNDPKQLEAVKVWAARGLGRACRVDDLPSETRFAIVNALSAQLKNTKLHWWYQMRVAEALGQSNTLYNAGAATRAPVVVQTLMEVMIDTQRPWIVRCEAAQSLGRLPYERNVHVGLIAYEIARLTQQMSEAYVRSPAQPEWNVCFLKVYLAFQPVDEEERKRKAGLKLQTEGNTQLAAHQKLVSTAYDQVVAIVKLVVNSNIGVVHADFKGQQETLDTWLKSNTPKDNQLDPKLPPLSIPAAAAQRPPNVNTTAPATGTKTAG